MLHAFVVPINGVSARFTGRTRQSKELHLLHPALNDFGFFMYEPPCSLDIAQRSSRRSYSEAAFNPSFAHADTRFMRDLSKFLA
jgi:hypothetical protein